MFFFSTLAFAFLFSFGGVSFSPCPHLFSFRIFVLFFFTYLERARSAGLLAAAVLTTLLLYY